MPDKVRDELLDIFEAVSKAQLRALRQLRQSPTSATRAARAAAGRPRPKGMSQIEMVYDILQAARRPLHVSEILSLVSQRFGVALDRESVVSALAKRVARQDRFLRTGPNTFALLPEEK